MARYRSGGVWRVCHVSTGNPTDCKTSWENIKDEPTVGSVGQFKPHEHVTAGNKIIGRITATGDFYAIGCSDAWVRVPENRSIEEILEQTKFQDGTLEDARRKFAITKSQGIRRIAGLKVECCVKVN
ncbi:MAG: hypothetical protein ABW168_24910 [Sedimenticola sp.]